MRPQLHKLPLNNDTCFLYSKWDCSFFDKPWHFHEEYELVVIDKSKGTKFIGDEVSLFEDGDLFLIGPNIPHLFRNNEEYYNEKANLTARSIFVHFTEDFLGKEFFSLPEMKAVRKLLDWSSYALQITGKIRNKVVRLLEAMESAGPSRRLLYLIEILILLSESKELNPLLSTRFAPNKNTNTGDADRINQVLDFIMKNYREKIYLSEIASTFNMSDAAFSRYFKHHTRKTFTRYVTEIRISHACRLLMQGDESIAQVGYLSGFENLSNFYRHFKAITGDIPKNYRNKFLKINLGTAQH